MCRPECGVHLSLIIGSGRWVGYGRKIQEDSDAEHAILRNADSHGGPRKLKVGAIACLVLAGFWGWVGGVGGQPRDFDDHMRKLAPVPHCMQISAESGACFQLGAYT